MKKVCLIIFLLSLFIIACDKKYKEVTFSYSDEFGFRKSESEIKAKADSAAYQSALLEFFISKKMHKTVYKDIENAYKPTYFELYNNEGDLVLPPEFSDKDIVIISSITQFEKEEIRDQIKINLYHY